MTPASAQDADRAEAVARADAAFARGSALIDRSLLIFGALALVLSMLMSPTPEVVSIFGFDVPVLCGFRAFTGQECPGCGLTRSFAYMGHLQPLAAFGVHKLGPLAWVVVVSQVPYRAWRLWRRR